MARERALSYHQKTHNHTHTHTHPHTVPSKRLKQRGYVRGGQQVAIVQSGRQPIWRSASTHAIQVRSVPKDPEPENEDYRRVRRVRVSEQKK